MNGYSSSPASMRARLRATYRFNAAEMTAHSESLRSAAIREASRQSPALALTNWTNRRISRARCFSPTLSSSWSQSSRGMRTRAMNVSPVAGLGTRRSLVLLPVVGHSVATPMPQIVATGTVAGNAMRGVICGNRNVLEEGSNHRRQILADSTSVIASEESELPL